MPEQVELAAEPMTVHERPVRAAQVSQVIAGVRLYDEGMLLRRRRLVQHDVALVVTTQDRCPVRQGYYIAVSGSTVHYEDRVAAGVVNGASPLAASFRAHLERLLKGPADPGPTRSNCNEPAHISPLGLCPRLGQFRRGERGTQGRGHQPAGG